MATLAEAIAVVRQHLDSGKLPEAESICRNILNSHPGHSWSWCQLGMIAHRQGNNGVALEHLRQAVMADFSNAGAHNMLGVILERLGRFDEAIACFLKVRELKPELPTGHFNLGNARQARRDFAEAVASYRKVLEIDPNHTDALVNMGVALKELGRREEAMECCRQALSTNPGHPDASLNLGALLQAEGKLDEALDHYRRALETRPDFPDAIAAETAILERKGETATAYQKVKPLIEAGTTNPDVTIVYSRLVRTQEERREAAVLLERILSGALLLDNKRQAALFALANLYDRLNDYDKAFDCYQRANATKPRKIELTPTLQLLERVADQFTPEFLAKSARATNESDLPVFIVGMPRSGTSLVEQVLATHPDVFGGGELLEIERIAAALPSTLGNGLEYPACLTELTEQSLNRFADEFLAHLRSLSPNARRITDKSTGNVQHLGLIELLFPKARVIHCVRDPLDTCLSAYFQNFATGHEYSCDLRSLGVIHRHYEQIMTHWHTTLHIPMLEVRYEALVENQELISRQILDFCGLEWDDRCLHFHQTSRMVRTASYAQVRQPLYKSSVRRYKNYEKHLDPLKEGLSRSEKLWQH